jgi:hypothetical protein
VFPVKVDRAVLCNLEVRILLFRNDLPVQVRVVAGEKKSAESAVAKDPATG